MNKLIMMIGAAAVASGVSADTTASYTSGDTSLAGGKITFAYDGGSITEMRMKPDFGETLTLSGDALNFAAGAQIVTSQQGTPVIANAISAAGTLRIGGVTNMAWSGSVFDRYTNPNWQTVLTNTRLDDIVPVSSTGAGMNGGTQGPFYPYWIVREGDTLRAELQAATSSYLLGLHLELKQEGDDIKARVINGGYLGATYTNYIGQSMFEHATLSATTNNNTAKKYGFTQLTFGRRRETRDYIGNLLSSSYDTVVATNTALEDVEILYAACNNNHVLKGWNKDTPYTLYPHHVSLTNDSLYAQLSLVDGTMTKCVKVRLCQSGNDVAARIVYAAYIDGLNDTDNDFDVNYTRNNWAIITQEKYDAGTTQGYGIDTLALRIKAKDKLTFAVSGTMDLNMPIGGQDAEVTFEAASAAATVNANAANTMTNSAYIIRGDADHVMKFYAIHINSANGTKALPQGGTTDAYGEGTELHLKGSTSGLVGGSAAGDSAITMHTGTKLYAESVSYAFRMTDQSLTLDGATLTLNKGSYLKWLTMENGATVDGSATLSFGYDGTSATWHVGGIGVSTFNRPLTLVGGRSKQTRELTLDVADTVAGDGVDFIMNGNLTYSSSFPGGVFAKTGAGTMLLNGTLTTLSPNVARIVEGTLRIGASNRINSDGALSLEGGALSFATNTANTVASIDVTAATSIAFDAGATLTVGTLTLGSGVETLSITSANGEYPIFVTNPLDAETLAKIRLNGKRVIQAGDGRLVRQGLIISVF